MTLTVVLGLIPQTSHEKWRSHVHFQFQLAEAPRGAEGPSNGITQRLVNSDLRSRERSGDVTAEPRLNVLCIVTFFEYTIFFSFLSS